MKIELNSKVTIRPRGTNLKIEGTVVKYQACEVQENNGIVWITDANGDQRKYFEGFDEIIIMRNKATENIAALEAFVYSKEAPFKEVNAYGDYEELTFFCDAGDYEIVIATNEYGYSLETIHQDRKARLGTEAATANDMIVKTLRGVIGYVDRFAF